MEVHLSKIGVLTYREFFPVESFQRLGVFRRNTLVGGGGSPIEYPLCTGALWDLPSL